MPYIKAELRAKVDALVEQLREIILEAPIDHAQNVGLMNYVLSCIVSAEIHQNLCYQTINEAMGVLACVQQELYRRLAAPYEDKKCAENGDVFDES